jgi:hypothetical protein
MDVVVARVELAFVRDDGKELVAGFLDGSANDSAAAMGQSE